MNSIQIVRSADEISVLGSTLRQKILRILMRGPATLTQIGESLGLHPANIRHHLKKLEAVNLVNPHSEKIVRGFVEKYYVASANAYHINQFLYPQTDRNATLIIAGSHDLALETLSVKLRENKSAPDIFVLPIGSLDGLFYLRQGICHATGCHLFDPVSQEFNLTYIRHLLPDLPVRVFSLAFRQQGIISRGGMKKKIKDVSDLVDTGIRFINRNKGSGTRVWFDNSLRDFGADASKIVGYENDVNTHTDLAQMIFYGNADAGIGLEAAARTFDLDFMPLFTERFDLVLAEEQFSIGLFDPLLDLLTTKGFRQNIDRIPGYSTQLMGQELIL